jgi:hypothetical protein
MLRSFALSSKTGKILRAALLGFICAEFACASVSAPALAKAKPAPKEEPAAQPDAKTDKKAGTKDAKSQKDTKAQKDPKTLKDSKDAKVQKDAKATQSDSKAQKDSKNSKGSGKAEQVATFGDWGVYATQGKDRTCYAMSQPKDRQPGKLKRDPAYLFVSSRPSESVRNEVAIMLGFVTKDNGNATADVDGDGYELVTKAQNAWVKDPAKEKDFVDSLKGGSKLVVKAPSAKGNLTTDVYSLKGLSQALDRVTKECQ